MSRPLSILASRTLAFSVIILFVVLPQILSAQIVPQTTIKGRVVDDSTNAPLPLANIFVSNSTIGTAADNEGRFALKRVPLGTQQVVASIVGYKPGSITLNLKDSIAVRIEIRLKQQPVQLSTVEVEAKDPVEWKKNLERFTKAFFGSTSNSQKCTLLNPQVVDFTLDEESSQLTATAREPLEIINSALGYRIHCVLQLFSLTPHNFRFLALTGFQLLQPQNKDVAEEWGKNRQNAYYGSKRHFLTSLVRNRARQAGFEVSLIRTEWIQAAMLRPMGFEMNPDTLLSQSDVAFEKKLAFPYLLQIVYGHGRARQYSVIEMSGPEAMVFSNGLMVNPLAIWTYGYWSSQRVADMLPMDYEPE
jgi:hypothetical protein